MDTKQPSNQPFMSPNQTNVQEKCQVIKPAQKTGLLLFQSFLMSLVGSFVVLMILGPVIFGLAGVLFGVEGILLGLIGVPIVFIIIWIVTYQLRRMSLDRTEYRFYGNRLEYFEGFLVKNRKTINYDKITNIGQRKGIVENWFGLGTILLDTPGSSPTGSELALPYMENPDMVYDWISKVVSAYSQKKN